MSDDPDYLFALQLQNQSDDDGDEPNKSTTTEMSDYQLALQLQAELNGDDDIGAAGDSITDADRNLQNSFGGIRDRSNVSAIDLSKRSSHKRRMGNDNYLDQTQNLVHPEWELVDPTPDIFGMFARFDEKFFQKRLGAVMVEWSKRMYSCAGICYQRSNGFLKEIIIRLSEPLLKLRSRKDLVETLLHEMIHAYCFVLNIREGNGGHGPNFKRIMGTINKVAGTNITVYHTFHDEVNAYKTHIWRCNGICQHHHPFLGYVKRTSNRAPGPNDQWWEKHSRECSGTFEKVSEPTKPTDRKGIKSKQDKIESIPSLDIRNYFDKPKPGKPSTIVDKDAGDVNKKRSNVVSLDSLQKKDNKEMPAPSKPTTAIPGQGYTLDNRNSSGNAGISLTGEVNRKHLRDVWSKRFENNTVKNVEDTKRRRLSPGVTAWESYDEDVMICNVNPPTIDISDSEDELPQLNKTKKPPMSSHERTLSIKREVMEDESFYSDSDIIMIDDEFDDGNDLNVASELADQSIIDDLFGEDTLLQEFQRENDLVPSGSAYNRNPSNDITTCPICYEKMKRSEFSNHLEGCSIVIRVLPPSGKGRFIPTGNKKSSISKPAGKKRKATASRPKQEVLKSFGYTDAEIAALELSSSSESENQTELTPRQIRQRNLFKQTLECPKCGQELHGHQLEAHRNICKHKRR